MTRMPADVDEGVRLVARALAPYEVRPGREELARLTDVLVRYGGLLRDRVAREGDGGGGALVAEWDSLLSRGPDGGLFGPWTFCRALARGVRGFHAALGVGPAPARRGR